MTSRRWPGAGRDGSGRDDSASFKRIERAARELDAALEELGFPALFIGIDLIWERLADTEENEESFARFRQALDHLATRAAERARPLRREVNLARDLFFLKLCQVWSELGLKVSTSATSRFVKFVEIASEGVCKLPDKNAGATISGVIRKWQSRPIV